jgi:hypothetical protein
VLVSVGISVLVADSLSHIDPKPIPLQ